MAALKKTKKSGSGAGLAIALVFFILLAIGLGVWGYYGYAGQDDLRKKAKEAELATSAAKAAEKYYRFLFWDLSLALGKPLADEEKPKYTEYRELFMRHHASADGDGEFKALGKPNPKDKEIVDDNAKIFGFDEKRTAYTKNVFDVRKTEAATLVALDKTAEGRLAAYETEKAKFNTLKKEQDAWWDKVFNRIKEDNEKIIDEAKKTYAQIDELLKEKDKLHGQITALEEQKDTEEKKLNKRIKELTDELKTALADRPEGAIGGPAGGGPARDPHALVLDISGFRPLWDRPLGDITALDLPNRTVFVRPNRNASKAFKTGLTFLVFAAGADGAAAGQLKGSLEVIREVDRNSYACRITSFFDIDRGEINLSDPAKLTGIRASRNALKEGDLIFNMFFGTRVALAGVFDIDGEPAATPADMARQLENTISFLNRRGVEVDAYIDPLTGEVKGAITAKTRFLIRGDDLETAAAFVGGGPATKDAPKKDGMPKGKEPMPKDGKEGKDGKDGEGKEKEVKEPEEKKADMPEGGGGRARVFEDALNDMRKKAIDNGLFIISRSNFNTVIGYYPPRHFGESTKISFIPRLPAATTLATTALGFIARDEMKMSDFQGEWEGGGWEAAFDKDGKAKVSFVTDRGGVPEIRVAPGSLSHKEGKYTLHVAGPTPLEFNITVSVGGTALQLEDLSGKLVPARIKMRKR